MIKKDQNLVKDIFSENVTQKAVRDGFGEGLVKAGEENENVVALSADLKDSTRVTEFAKKFKDRYIEMGVAEYALVLVSAGFANYGKIPFATSYAVFSPGRTFEGIKVTIALNDVPVKIVGAHAGVGAGPYGATHQSLEDISLMRVIPNMTIVSPADAVEAKKATIKISKNQKPTYLRLAREKTPLFTTEDSPFEIGKANVLWEQKDPKVTIIATGPIVYEALKAAKILEGIGIDSIVINNHTVKPMDEQEIIKSAKIAGAVVTAEEHNILGGMGSAVSEILSKNYPVPIEMVGLKDMFSESGNPEELKKKLGLTTDDIVSKVKKVVMRRFL